MLDDGLGSQLVHSWLAPVWVHDLRVFIVASSQLLWHDIFGHFRPAALFRCARDKASLQLVAIAAAWSSRACSRSW